jgi:hypothetical protein
MTNDEILLMAEQSVNKLCVIAVTNDDLVAFAKAIAAKEREACAEICDARAEADTWEGGYAHQCANEIRARSKDD